MSVDREKQIEVIQIIGQYLIDHADNLILMECSDMMGDDIQMHLKRRKEETRFKDVPVICPECVDTGKVVTIRGVRHLSCGLMNDKPVFGSKPSWCPKGSIWPDEELKK